MLWAHEPRWDLVATPVLADVLENQLLGVTPLDPVTLGASAGKLIAVALVACLIPARHATRIDPMVVLREE